MASNIPFPPSSTGPASSSASPSMSIEIPHRSEEHRKEQQHTGRTFHHHPRQPGPSSDSYFSGSLTSSGPPRTPGSLRGHSRNVSSTSAILKSQPMTTGISAPNGPPHPDFGGQWTPQPQSAWGGFGSRGGGLPSPSTLTDILLGLHSTLYGGKKSPEEVREMVWRYYDADATFESPLLSASGREQVANQFIMAFALPGLDVTSELRDVICSDFEFDGTRAGIIDQTISVTILPSIFGSSEVPHAYPSSSHAHPTTAHPNSVTPHPFADYKTPGASAFSHVQHSPTTPYSISSMWGGGASRPHTPGAGPWSAGASGIRPFTSSAHPRAETPPSVNGDDEDISGSTVRYSADQAGGGTISRLRMPLDAVTPHWASQGLGRSTFGSLLWGLFHPRAVLRNLCTIQLRLMSRLEFNDAGHIVRHEDTWGLRETIEGTIPFASLLYALERRVVGYITSWAVGKGFSLSSALHPRAIHGPVHESELALLDGRQQRDADEAAHALLGRSRNMSGFHQHEHFQTISRSRAPSPTRMGWSASATSTPFVTGTRSRARSSAGSLYGGSRTASSDNLHSLSHSGFATGFERGADKDLPPDSSARYRSLNRRLDGGRASSTTSAPPSEIAGSSEEYVRSKAPDRDPSL